jgi:hypothetical protein
MEAASMETVLNAAPITGFQQAIRVTSPSNFELRENGELELRQDFSFELRELGN